MRILIVLMLLAGTAHAWSDADTVREGVWQGLNVIDTGQTLFIARNPTYPEGSRLREYHEINPLLGRHPTPSRAAAMMSLGAVAHVAISAVLPEKARAVWQYVTIGESAFCVIHNHQIGIQISF